METFGFQDLLTYIWRAVENTPILTIAVYRDGRLGTPDDSTSVFPGELTNLTVTVPLGNATACSRTQNNDSKLARRRCNNHREVNLIPDEQRLVSEIGGMILTDLETTGNFSKLRCTPNHFISFFLAKIHTEIVRAAFRFYNLALSIPTQTIVLCCAPKKVDSTQIEYIKEGRLKRPVGCELLILQKKEQIRVQFP